MTQLVQVALYDLPDKNCAARSAPVLDFTVANNGQAGYMAFIDQVAAIIARGCLAAGCGIVVRLLNTVNQCIPEFG